MRVGSCLPVKSSEYPILSRSRDALWPMIILGVQNFVTSEGYFRQCKYISTRGHLQLFHLGCEHLISRGQMVYSWWLKRGAWVMPRTPRHGYLKRKKHNQPMNLEVPDFQDKSMVLMDCFPAHRIFSDPNNWMTAKNYSKSMPGTRQESRRLQQDRAGGGHGRATGWQPRAGDISSVGFK